MAYSLRLYTATGSSKRFPVAMNYLDKAHVHVYLDGVETTSFFWPTDQEIELLNTPVAGTVVGIQRITPKDDRLVDFQNASMLNEDLLDRNTLQVLFVMQEADDKANNALILANDNTYDALNKRIKNLGTPTQAKDAVTKEYADQTVVRGEAAASLAQVSAAAAQTSETNAKTSENNAKASEIAAAASADAALDSQNAAAASEANAAASAANAANSAAEALVFESNAAASASAAAQSESNAAESAADAAASAQAAQNSRDEAAAHASDALLSYYFAHSSAITADQRALDAGTAANSAANSAALAQQIVDSISYVVPYLIEDSTVSNSAATSWTAIKTVRMYNSAGTARPKEIRVTMSCRMSSSSYVGHIRVSVYNSGSTRLASTVDSPFSNTSEIVVQGSIPWGSSIDDFLTLKLEVYRSGGTIYNSFWEIDFVK